MTQISFGPKKQSIYVTINSVVYEFYKDDYRFYLRKRDGEKYDCESGMEFKHQDYPFYEVADYMFNLLLKETK